MKSLKGHLLIAAPELGDPNFVRTVVIIAEHNDEGAFGIVLNRPSNVNVGELLRSIPGFAPLADPADLGEPTFVGGPVQRGSVMLLHRFDETDFGETGSGETGAGGVEIVPGVRLANELPVLDRVLELEAAVPVDDRPGYRLFCGYAGWGEGQLDAELRAGGWLTLTAERQHVFDVPPTALWTRVLGEVGGKYKLFSLMPPDPEKN